MLIRVTPDVRGETHEKISTGQADSKFGFAMAEAPAAIARVRARPGLDAARPAPHIGSQLLELEPFRDAIAASRARSATSRSTTSAAGSACAYTDEQPSRRRSRSTSARSSAGARATGSAPAGAC